MAEEIIDGTGTGKKAKVNNRNRLETSTSTYSESRLISAQDGLTFTWTTLATAANDTYIAYLKCDSTTHRLIIDKVTVGSALAASIFELYQVTGTAAGGSVVTGKNTNIPAGIPAQATARGEGSVTGLTDLGRIDNAHTGVDGRATMELKDILILGQTNAIAVKYTGTTGSTGCIITGYFKPIEELTK
jgi:hypothetical protein